MPDSEAPRASMECWLPTEAEKIARYDIVVSTGTYERGGSELTMTPIVTRVPEFVGGANKWGYRLTGNALVLTFLDEYSFDGVQAPWVGTGGGHILSLSRVAP